MSTLLDLWTNLCLVLFFAAFAVWCGTVMYVHGRGFVGRAREFFRRQPVWVCIFLPFFFVKLWGYGSVKSGGGELGDDGGTNAPPEQTMNPSSLGGGANGFFGMLPLPEGGQTSSFDLQIVSSNETDGSTSVLVPRELTAEDFARGFVMARIGMGERWDFSVPSNATVCADWRAFGAATDWIYFSPPDWATSVGTNESKRLRVFSFGKVQPFLTNATGRVLTDTWFAPLQASLGIVPEGNWHLLALTNAPSLFWHNVTPYDSLLLTWQNVLLGRLAENPVSFQAEFFPDGRFTYRYDFSRLNADALTNLCVGASFAGFAWTTNALPTNVTSMAFYPLSPEDAIDPDSDGDGLTTTDELFVYGTDPHATDSDLDGLSDFEELAETGTDPLEAHSVSDVYNDAFALKIGDLDPFACPEGSTNTVFEHIFYTGTTNAPFAYPQSSDTHAVLKVSVSGTGAGDLIVGDQVVPLLPMPQRARGMVAPSELWVRLVRGVKHTLRLRTQGDIDVVLSSDDFCIGRWPSVLFSGWAAFPYVRAIEPCIHDLGAKKTLVSLDSGTGFDNLICTWNEAEDIEVENLSPRAARLTGRFPPDTTTPVTYTLSHPDYLCGETTYAQTARFCPTLPEENLPDDEHGILEEYGDDDSDGIITPEPIPCPNEPTGAFTNVQEWTALGNVLKLFPQPSIDRVHLEVPDAPIICCPCPDHHTNAVHLAAKSYNLAVRTEAGERFSVAANDMDVFVSGLAPSKDFSDSVVMFSQTGVVCKTSRYTVLGMQISHPSYDLVAVTNMCPSLGLPVLAGTNDTITTLRLGAFVDLPTGDIRLKFRNATARFKLYLGSHGEENNLLLDTEIVPEVIFSLEYWRYLTRDHANGHRVHVVLVALDEGFVELDFDFAAVENGFAVTDGATLKLTAIPPPLLADYNRDGIIGNVDKSMFQSGRPLRHWINGDNDEGNVATSTSDLLDQGTNADCLNGVVDGRCDLLDFAPVGLDLDVLSLNICTSSQYEFRLVHEDEAVNLLETDLSHTQADGFLKSDWGLDSASVTRATRGGMTIPATRQVVLLEGVSTTTEPLVLSIRRDGQEIISFKLPLSIWHVDGMIRWMNLRGFLTGNVDWWDVQDWEPANLPDAETKNVNVFFLHGFKVSEEESRAWGAEMFKRLWQSGSNARFWAVTWLGDGGTPTGFHYNDNVYNAFLTAPYLASRVNQFGTGEKIVMAHSLGNMVVSSAIQDHGMNVSKYFMLNSAVPAEAYNSDCFDDSPDNPLVHDYWREYTNQTWSCKWHELFDSADDRNKLTWKNRFPDVASIAYNYYSSGDEVLEMLSTGTPEFYDGATDSLGRYAWHKQESYKGRLGLDNNPLAWAGTTWSGWGFRRCVETLENARLYTAQEANAIPREALTTNTVFKVYPTSMNTNVIPRIMLDEHLAMGIPALSPATGVSTIGLAVDKEINLNYRDASNPRSGWWRPGDDELDQKWLHSDIKDAAYHYIYPTFDDLVDRGGLK